MTTENKNHQWMVKSVGKSMMRKRIFAETQRDKGENNTTMEEPRSNPQPTDQN